MGKLTEMVIMNESTRVEMLDAVRKIAPDKVAKFEKAYKGRSLTASITAKCLECRDCNTQKIRHCSITDCALYNIRPYQSNQHN
jgi:hypothetical protein